MSATVAVPSAVWKSTDALSPVLPVLVTVKINEVVPLLPSLCVTPSIEKLGAASSFTIVPVPSAVPIVALTAADRWTVNASFVSNVVSPFTSTVICFVVSVAAKFSVPQATIGTHSVIAVGQTSSISATASFQVKPKTGLRSSSGTAGSQNVLHGYGFGPREAVTAHWNSPTGPVLGSPTRTNTLGTFIGGSAITFTVPLSPTGTYKVYGVSASGSASSKFTLN